MIEISFHLYEINVENFIFIPVLLDQVNNDILVYSQNPIYDKWNLKKI